MHTKQRKTAFSCTRRSLCKGMGLGLLGAVLAPNLAALPVQAAPATTAAGAAAGAAASTARPQQSGKKTLIVYYSRSGNTRQIVEQIQKTIAADVLELKTVDPYPAEYRATTEQAKKELAAGYRPPLRSKLDNPDDYDTVIIGSPNWWGTVAMPVFTFLESYNLSGKRVALFITHGGSRLGRALDDVKKLCPNAVVLEALAVRDRNVPSAQKDVDAWLKATGLAAETK